MKFPSTITLLCTATCLCLAACSPGPETDEEPIAGPASDQTSGSNETAGNDGEGGTSGSISNNPLTQRLRLPDMTGLPTDKELASKPKPDTGGGGVIARPPSE